MSLTTTQRLRRVQVRTTAIAMVSVIIVLTVGAIALLRYFEREQVRQVDAGLQAVVPAVEQAAASDPSPATAELVADALIQAVDRDGNVIFASDRLQGVSAMRTVGDEQPTNPETVSVDGVGSVRVIAIPFQDNWVLLAGSLRNVDDATATLRTVLLLGVPLLAVLLGVLLWIVVGRTLRPVRDAIEREERLVADVSHELRTPIAGMRALLESESEVPDEIELNRLEALAVLERLETLTNGLMIEARNAHGEPLRAAQPVDLDEIALRVVERATPRAGLDIDVSGVSGGQVRGNPDDLERMIANLLNNAMRHAQSQVRVAVVECDDIVTLTVSDDGPGIPVADRERIYERFTRLDDARSRDRGGVGLGLPIVLSVVTAHHGSMTTDQAPIGGAEFVVRLPASVSGPPTN